MYAKLFTSLYQGTLRGCADEILVFTNLLAHADATGLVDKHWRSISEETGISVERVKTAIANLEAPDPESRSPEQEGRRIMPLDEHRAWGWHIVNYGKYRAIRNEDDRREQNRLAQQRWRDKQKSGDVNEISRVSQDKPKQKQEAEAEEKEEKSSGEQPRKRKVKQSTDEWLTVLKKEECYAHVNFEAEMGKAQVWINNHPGRKLTKPFFIAWINKIEAPLNFNGNKPPDGCEICRNHPNRKLVSLKTYGWIFNTETRKLEDCICKNGTA